MKRLVALLALALAACGGKSTPAPAPVPRPSPTTGTSHNVLLITIDTLRADHMGTYGYKRETSPRMDAFGAGGAVFERAYSYWPKTRASMIMMLTGRRPSQNGFSKTHPVLLGFNPTLASVLKEAGYVTAAALDNANLAKGNGYAKGFDTFRETWEEKSLRTEMDRTKAITDTGVRFLRAAPADQPFFLWLHYVNPHAPYTPPPPYDTSFLDGRAGSGPRLPVVKGFHGGIPEQWAVSGHDRAGYYVAQYDGEIATVDQEVGQVIEALNGSSVRGHTIVVVTSDHGESLGEHDYYFDHGADLYDPCLAVPLMIAGPGIRRGHSRALASTLDIVPTILDAVKVSYPPDLAGESLLAALAGGPGLKRDRLFAQNDLNLSATWDETFKLVAEPVGGNTRYLLFDRREDPAESRNVRASSPEPFRVERRALELFFERADQEWAHTRPLVEGTPPGEGKMTPEACEKLKALGYVAQCNR